MNSQTILPIYKLNILSTTILKHTVYNETASATFSQALHLYLTGFSKSCYKVPKRSLSKCKYRISTRGVLIWNNLLSFSEKKIESSSLFKSKVKLKLLAFEMRSIISKIFCSIKYIFLCWNAGLDEKVKMAFCESFLNHMKWESQSYTLHPS